MEGSLRFEVEGLGLVEGRKLGVWGRGDDWMKVFLGEEEGVLRGWGIGFPGAGRPGVK
jgi:hypothetical protein